MNVQDRGRLAGRATVTARALSSEDRGSRACAYLSGHVTRHADCIGSAVRARPAAEIATRSLQGPMAQLLLEFRSLVCAPDGTAYRARAWGAEAGDRTGLWHGWIEFTPAAGGAAIRTARETSQPNLTDTLYWATGLLPVYLEGALQRALRP